MKKVILSLSLFLSVNIYADYVDTETGAYIQDLGNGNSVNTVTGEYIHGLSNGDAVDTSNNNYYLNNYDND